MAGWHDLPNLVWAARHRMLTATQLKKHLPARADRWPEPLKELALEPEGFSSRTGYWLMRAVHGLLFPHEIDLHPFRILLLLELTDCTPEELHVVCEGDIAFSREGVRVVQRKRRAGRVRADFHPLDEVALDEERPGEWVYPGAGNWDTPGLFRRLHAATALSREAFEQPWLFTAVEADRHRAAMLAGLALFTRKGRRFTQWIGAHDGSDGTLALDISRPHDVRRLRKTAKTSKVAALGGTLTDLAGDDHHIEVFRGHYAHGTTVHVLAGKAINKAQNQVFKKVTATKPVLITAEAEASLVESGTAQALDLTQEQAGALASGDLDMGLTGCRDPYASPHTAEGKLCHVAPAMCMLCRNAIVFTSQLPRLLMLSDHIDQMRLVLAPERWQAVWGGQAAALAEVFQEVADQIPAARQEIEDKKLRLDLPLGMRTEYER